MLVRHRLILRFMALVITIQLCLTAFIYYYSARARELRFYHRLEMRAHQTASLLIHRLGLDPQVLRSFRKKDLLTMHNGRITIYDDQRRLVFHIQQNDEPIPPQYAAYFPQITTRKPARFRVGHEETFGILVHHKGRRYWLFMAGRDYYGGLEFATLRLILLIGNLGALVLIIGAAWLFAERSLKPLSRMVAEVDAIRAPNLNRRIHEGNGRDEIARLAITFNRMLGGLEQAFQVQKSFFAHASHELRTPLATLLGILETSSAYDAHLSDSKRSIDSAIEETQSIIDLTNGLLTLAKTDDPSFPKTQVALDECVVQAIAMCAGKYPDRLVKLEVGEWPDAAEDLFAVCGNMQLLTTALFNLLDNACKYSEQAVQVSLTYSNANTVLVRVVDSGIGIQEQALGHVREPLYRAPNGQAAPGFGLGLTITDRIIQQHGGQLTLKSALGQGCCVSVHLPAAR